MDEAILIAGLKQGDNSSYETLFKLYYVRFVKFADAIIDDRQAAEDLVQEAFMKVWLNRSKLVEGLSISNYLYVLVKRAAINFLRDRKFAEEISAELGESLRSGQSVESSFSADETLRQNVSSVEQLPERRRNVFRLSRGKGMSNKEIARELNVSEKTVERQITLALQDIRKTLS